MRHDTRATVTGNYAAAHSGIHAAPGYGWCPTCWREVHLKRDGSLREHQDVQQHSCYGRFPYIPGGAA